MTASPPAFPVSCAENAKKSDHVGDANRDIVPTCAENALVGMPSEETIARLLCKLDGLNPDLPRSWNDDELLWTEWREPAQQVLSLIRPAFEAKDAEIDRLTNNPGHVEGAVRTAGKNAVRPSNADPSRRGAEP